MKKLSCYFFGLSLLLNHALLTVAAPIDNAAIADPDQQGDWRAYGRSYSERRFSPLRQIADDNVGQLKLDWYLDMPDSRALNATPITYAIDGTQYIAVLAGWGGASYIGSTAMAHNGWAYGAQPRRLLVFSLECTAKSPPITPPQTEIVIIDDPRQVIDNAQAQVGQDVYLPMCLGCHGFAAISGGGAPNLRASAAAADLATFTTILHSGPLQSKGMPRFDELSAREVEQIYWYIRQRARQSLPRVLRL